MCIVYTHIRFMKALKAQGISRDSLPYKVSVRQYKFQQSSYVLCRRRSNHGERGLLLASLP